MKEFKIRCSAIGDIMAGEIGLTEKQCQRLDELNSRTKALTANMVDEFNILRKKRDNPELPLGAKTYCKKWIKKTLYNRNENWKSIVIDKGLAVEEDAIKLVAKVYGIEGLSKNEDYFSNEYCEGSPDVIQTHNLDIVRDTKCSWDLFTFPMFDDVIPKEGYEYQLLGYMWLTGIRLAALDYVLIDTPLPLVQQDLKKLYYQSGGVAEDWTPEKHESLLPNYKFDDIPDQMRVKSFYIEYDDTFEKKVIERVEMCREYISKILGREI